MKYKELFGNSIKQDIDEIKREIDDDPSIVFVYSGTQTLYDYIDALYDKGRGLDAEYLYKFKVCYEKKDLRVSYSARGGKRSREIISMSSLVNELDGKSSCKIVVESNDRVQLAFIVQQLIFIEYPLEKVDILLRKEEKDADKTKRFMKNVNELLDGCEKAITRLTALRHEVETEMDDNNPTKAERLKDIDDALGSCASIKAQILKSIDVELKFAVAASKKAGKSVIVNCFLGEQIAPTSTELATPNNCFYKRSPDNLYHLQLEGGGQQDFDTRQEIYDVINSHFRTAQNDKDQGFALPDMHIGYVTDENNFSSYTIFDTAGPDAAGTAHADVAEKAMQRCDVAVFAIDYSKYLTTSEEDYLRRVKEMFTAQNKFHSLIFALNKIDVRYTDTESPKSFVMSVDFLKTRLANIDEAYRDCIIFPTCSLEYFSAIEAEKAGITELDADNYLPIGEMKRIKFAHKDVPALAWLHTHSENLEYYHGIQTISYDVFKKDSGMPALMSYVSYVAQSKARDEIVNNVTFEIDSQKMKIQSILAYIENLEKFINADDEKIDTIARIIEEYEKSVKQVLVSYFSGADLDCLDAEALLNLDAIKGDYKKLIDMQKKVVDHLSVEQNVADSLYDQMVDSIWQKIKKKIQSGDSLTGTDIEQLFTTDDFKRSVNSFLTLKTQAEAGVVYKQLCKLSEEFQLIVNKRKERIEEISSKCTSDLAKEDVTVQLPAISEFTFSSEMPSPGTINVSVSDIDLDLFTKLRDLFYKFSIKNIGVWFKKLFGDASDKDYYYEIDISNREKFVKTCDEKLKSDFQLKVYQNKIANQIYDVLKRNVIDIYMTNLINELEKAFLGMNNNFLECIARFNALIDDRDKYKDQIALYNLRKDNIEAIGNCTSDFMGTWNVIIQDFIEDDDTASEKVLVTV